MYKLTNVFQRKGLGHIYYIELYRMKIVNLLKSDDIVKKYVYYFPFLLYSVFSLRQILLNVILMKVNFTPYFFIFRNGQQMIQKRAKVSNKLWTQRYKSISKRWNLFIYSSIHHILDFLFYRLCCEILSCSRC